jgi:cyclic nucleotide-binding protein
VSATPAPVKRDPLEAIRAAFGTGDLRRMQFGWAATSVGSWAFMVVLAVYAYVIAEGRVGVECDGEPLRVEGPGEFFGEIALLRGVPRTATVHATEPGLLYALERETFVCGSPTTRAA